MPLYPMANPLKSPSPSTQTLTASPIHPAPADLHPSSDQLIISALSDSSYAFLQPTPSLHTAALLLAKRYLDPLATSISQAQEQRLDAARKKRKRGEADDAGTMKVLRLKQVHLEGFSTDQVWEQARRVLDASRQEVGRHLAKIPHDQDRREAIAPDGAQDDIKTIRFDEDGFEVDDSGVEDIETNNLEAEGTSEDEVSLHAGEVEEALLGDESVDGDEGKDEIEEGEDIEMDEADLEIDDEMGEKQAAGSFVPDKHGLNDGFFSIDDFNRTSEFLEQQYAREDPNGGAASDEEEIDWDADPMGRPLSRPENEGGLNGNSNGYDDSDDDGPTFGNADLNAPDTSDSDDDADEIDDTMDTNTNEIKYADFFAPPPRALTKSARRRPLPKTQPSPSSRSQPAEDDIQRTISAVRRDLFEDDLSEHSEHSDMNSTPGNNNLSTHEKRQAALSAQIRQLEAANVAKRDWTLSGEARAAERPINSLLEEDLEFEQAGKPVTVVTKEVSEDIEALIKRRILGREFDEVIRRRPGAVPAPEVRRGKLELEDTRDKRGLADVYEEEHLARLDPTGHADKRDATLRRQHEEIARLWKDVAGKLDALSNWHYKPQPPEVNLSVVSDVPAVRMEDARPSGIGGVGEGASMLAPQEIYKPGDDKSAREVIAGGKPVAREEMTREEKSRRRRREKERIRKAGGVVEKKGGAAGSRDGNGSRSGKRAGEGTRTKEKKEVVKELKRGGVRVIGRKGELRDVEGAVVKGQGGGKGAGGLKL